MDALPAWPQRRGVPAVGRAGRAGGARAPGHGGTAARCPVRAGPPRVRRRLPRHHHDVARDARADLLPEGRAPQASDACDGRPQGREGQMKRLSVTLLLALAALSPAAAQAPSDTLRLTLNPPFPPAPDHTSPIR